MAIKIWKDKEGNKITFKEFMKRFKSGISMITPIQKLRNDVRATFISLVGYVVGLLALFIYRDKFVVVWFTWGLIIIFLGAVWSNFIKWWALKQQLKLFDEFNSNAVDLNSILDNLEELKEDEEVKEDKEVTVSLDKEPLKGMSEVAKSWSPTAFTKEEIKALSGTKVYDEASNISFSKKRKFFKSNNQKENIGLKGGDKDGKK